MILLAGTQRSLRSISIGPLQPNAMNLIDCLKPWPPTVRTIIIPWRLLSVKDLEFYKDLIERSRGHLRALTVRTNDFEWVPGVGIDPDTCEQLVRGLFDHAEGDCYDKPPLYLVDLNLQNRDLSNFDTTWNRYIDFAKLRTMQIWNCKNADAVLGCLIRLAKTRTLQLHGLVLSFDSTGMAPYLTEDFLRCIFGLKYLNICYLPANRGQMLKSFDVRCLSSHVDTLQDLYLGMGTNSAMFSPKLESCWITGCNNIEWLVNSCRRLKQLAVAMPEVTMTDALGGRWGSYIQRLVGSPVPRC